MSGYLFLKALAGTLTVSISWIVLTPVFNFFYEFGQLNGVSPMLLTACNISWWISPLLFLIGTWYWYFQEVQKNEQLSRPI